MIFFRQSQLYQLTINADELLERTERTLSFGRAESRDLQSLRKWVDGNRTIARDETTYLSEEKDLVSLAPRLDSATARFEDWIEDWAARFFSPSKLVSPTIPQKQYLLTH